MRNETYRGPQTNALYVDPLPLTPSSSILSPFCPRSVSFPFPSPPSFPKTKNVREMKRVQILGSLLENPSSRKHQNAHHKKKKAHAKSFDYITAKTIYTFFSPNLLVHLLSNPDSKGLDAEDGTPPIPTSLIPHFAPLLSQRQKSNTRVNPRPRAAAARQRDLCYFAGRR